MLEKDIQGILDEVVRECVRVEQQQDLCPVDSLAYRRHLFDIQPSHGLNEINKLGPEILPYARHARFDDLLLQGGVGEGDKQVEAAPLQGLAQLPGAVAGQKDERLVYRFDRADLRDRHLEIGEHFQQKGLEFLVRLVYFINEQDGAFGMLQRLEQRPGLQEMTGEEYVVVLVELVN